MMREYKGMLIGLGRKAAIIVSRIDAQRSAALFDEAFAQLTRLSVRHQDITAIWTPSAAAIPLVYKEIALTGYYDLAVALACDGDSAVIGEVIAISAECRLPIGIGIGGTEVRSAAERAASEAVETADLLERIRSSDKDR